MYQFRGTSKLTHFCNVSNVLKFGGKVTKKN